jgi:hypothetical protein
MYFTRTAKLFVHLFSQRTDAEIEKDILYIYYGIA